STWTNVETPCSEPRPDSPLLARRRFSNTPHLPPLRIDTARGSCHWVPPVGPVVRAVRTVPRVHGSRGGGRTPRRFQAPLPGIHPEAHRPAVAEPFGVCRRARVRAQKPNWPSAGPARQSQAHGI